MERSLPYLRGIELPKMGTVLEGEFRKVTGETKAQFARYVVLRYGEENAFPNSASVEEYILDLLMLRDCLWYLEKMHKRKYLPRKAASK